MQYSIKKTSPITHFNSLNILLSVILYDLLKTEVLDIISCTLYLGNKSFCMVWPHYEECNTKQSCFKNLNQYRGGHWTSASLFIQRVNAGIRIEFSNTEKNKEGLRVHGISTSVLCISKGWNTAFQTTELASLQSLLYELQKQNLTYWSNTHPKKHKTASPGISRSPQWALMRNLRLHLHCRTSCTEKLYSARTH